MKIIQTVRTAHYSFASLLMSLAIISACGPGSSAPNQTDAVSPTVDPPMHEVVVELQTMIERNGWTSMFQDAVASANSQNVATIQHVDTLDEYYG